MRRLMLAAAALVITYAPARGQNPVLDLYGDALPPGAVARFGTLRLEPGCRAWAIAPSPDGKFLATGDEHGKLRIWDTAGGKELRVFDCKAHALERGEDIQVGAVAFVPGLGRLRVAGGNSRGKLRVWEIDSGKLVLEEDHLQWHAGFGGLVPLVPGALAASADGKLLAIGAGHEIHLWNLADGKKLRHWTAHNHGVISLAFTPDGRGLLSGGRSYEHIGGDIRLGPRRPNDDYALALWDPATGKLQNKFREQHVESRVLGFTADGRSWGSLGWGKEGWEFRLWVAELRTRAVLSLKDLRTSIGAAALSPDGKTLAIPVARAIGLWDVASGKRLDSLKDAHEYLPIAVAFMPDGKTLAASGVQTRIHFWDLITRKPRHVFEAHERSIRALAVAPDGRTAVTGGPDGLVREWDVATGKPLRVLRHPERDTTYLVALRYTSDGKSLGCAYFGGISLWDAAKGRRLRTIPAPPGKSRIVSMHFSPDGKAFWHLRRAPDRAVALLDKHVRPIPAIDPARLEQLLKDLDSPVFAVREKATDELTRIADHVATRLSEYAKEPLALEVRRRLERVLPKVGGALETRRLLWSIRLLEIIGGNEARRLVGRMTEGEPNSIVTQQARAALHRAQKAQP